MCASPRPQLEHKYLESSYPSFFLDPVLSSFTIINYKLLLYFILFYSLTWLHCALRTSQVLTSNSLSTKKGFPWLRWVLKSSWWMIRRVTCGQRKEKKRRNFFAPGCLGRASLASPGFSQTTNRAKNWLTSNSVRFLEISEIPSERIYCDKKSPVPPQCNQGIEFEEQWQRSLWAVFYTSRLCKADGVMGWPSSGTDRKPNAFGCCSENRFYFIYVFLADWFLFYIIQRHFPTLYFSVWLSAKLFILPGNVMK